MKFWSMLLIAIAGLMGAGGVAAGAAAAHLAGGALETAAVYLLIHAAAIVAICINYCKSKIFLAAAGLLAVGAILFGGDLALRALAGFRLFPMAAPSGGGTMIAGWLILAAGGLVHLFGKR